MIVKIPQFLVIVALMRMSAHPTQYNKNGPASDMVTASVNKPLTYLESKKETHSHAKKVGHQIP